MEYQRLNKQEKAKYHFSKFKEEFDEWNCSNYATKNACTYNRILLLKLKFLPNNEYVANTYSQMCNNYSDNITK